MPEADVKRKRRYLTNAVVVYFSKLFRPETIYFLDGNPFNVEISDPGTGLTYKIRSVVGEVTQQDRDEVANRPLNPTFFRKYIAYRTEEHQKDFELIQIK